MQLTSLSFDLVPEGGESAVVEFGQGGIADGRATDFRWAVIHGFRVASASRG
jgi:hypothetical protein